jgi:hypothetical protein
MTRATPTLSWPANADHPGNAAQLEKSWLRLSCDAGTDFNWVARTPAGHDNFEFGSSKFYFSAGSASLREKKNFTQSRRDAEKITL